MFPEPYICIISVVLHIANNPFDDLNEVKDNLNLYPQLSYTHSLLY